MASTRFEDYARLGADAVDELIRRRFSKCETLPLFSDPPAPRRGFFELPVVGRQTRMFEATLCPPPSKTSPSDAVRAAS